MNKRFKFLNTTGKNPIITIFIVVILFLLFIMGIKLIFEDNTKIKEVKIIPEGYKKLSTLPSDLDPNNSIKSYEYKIKPSYIMERTPVVPGENESKSVNINFYKIEVDGVPCVVMYGYRKGGIDCKWD